MADDLGIPKFSFLNFRRLSLRFQRTSSFLPKLVQPIRCAYTDCVTESKLLRKTCYLSTSTGNTFYTPLCFL